jgi:hypothetical protein
VHGHGQAHLAHANEMNAGHQTVSAGARPPVVPPMN